MNEHLDIDEIAKLAKKAVSEIEQEFDQQGLAKLSPTEQAQDDKPFIIDMQDSYKKLEAKNKPFEEAMQALDKALARKDKLEEHKDKEEKKVEERLEEKKEVVKEAVKEKKPQKEEIIELKEEKKVEEKKPPLKNELEKDEFIISAHNEKVFLENIRERVLVLFEGLSSSPLDEQKFELTINFLEFLLAKIEDRLEK